MEPESVTIIRLPEDIFVYEWEAGNRFHFLDPEIAVSLIINSAHDTAPRSQDEAYIASE